MRAMVRQHNVAQGIHSLLLNGLALGPECIGFLLNSHGTFDNMAHKLVIVCI